jgi:hypothetical protein
MITVHRRRLAELIKLIVQVLDDVLCFDCGEFFICHMTAIAQPLFQRIQRMNESVLAGVDASIVASHAVSVMQALPFGAVARQCGGVSARHQQYQQRYAQKCFSLFASDVWGVGSWRLIGLLGLQLRQRLGVKLADLLSVRQDDGDLLIKAEACSIDRRGARQRPALPVAFTSNQQHSARILGAHALA